MTDQSSISGITEESSPFDFTAEQWSIITRTNAVLNAFIVKHGQAEISRSKFPAFQFREDIEGVPPFDVMDDSSINITELTSDFESSALNSCFSAKDVKATLDGGLLAVVVSGGVGLSGGGSASTSRSSSSTTVQKSSRNDLYAAYEFPRVVLYLDETSIEPSRPCKQALTTLRNDPSLEAVLKFMDRFGHIFSREVALGGRLQCLRASQSVSGSTVSEKRDNLRAEASAQFSAFTASAGMSGSRGRLEDGMSGLSVSDTASSIAWEARGGDTTLSANPSAWATTIKPYRNWRVIHRNEVVPTYELLGSCEGYEWVPEVFSRALKQVPTPKPVKQATPIEKVVEVPEATFDVPPLMGTHIATTFLRVRQEGGYSAPLLVKSSIIFYQDVLGFIRCGFNDWQTNFFAPLAERICRGKSGTPLATVGLLENSLSTFFHAGRISTLRIFYLNEQSILCDHIYSFTSGTWNRQTSKWSGEWTAGSLQTIGYKVSPQSFLSVASDTIDNATQPSTAIVLGFISHDGIFTVARHFVKTNTWQTLQFGSSLPNLEINSVPYLAYYEGWLTIKFLSRDGQFKSLRSDFAGPSGQSPTLGPHKLVTQPKHAGLRSRLTVHGAPQSLQLYFSSDIDNTSILYRKPNHQLMDIATIRGTKTSNCNTQVCFIPEKSRFVCVGQLLDGIQVNGGVVIYQDTDSSLVLISICRGSMTEPKKLFRSAKGAEFTLQDYYNWAYTRGK